jgi:L-threonylcarbamoyladenylate synthase
MKTKVLPAEEPIALTHAVDVLRNNGTVAFPTDTVYGLGAMAFQSEGIERLYTIKGRRNVRAIAVLLSETEDLKKATLDPSHDAIQLANRFWPGPLTLVVPRHPDLPDLLAPNQTIGVRVPDHPIALKLLRQTGPLAVTSANLSGEKNTHTVNEVLAQLHERVHLILDGGKTPGGMPSTVVDLTTEEFKILRTGPISKADIKSALRG